MFAKRTMRIIGDLIFDLMIPIQNVRIFSV